MLFTSLSSHAVHFRTSIVPFVFFDVLDLIVLLCVPPAAERTLSGRGGHAVPAGARARALGAVEQDVPEPAACVLLVRGGVERAAAEPERGGAWVWWDTV